MNDSLKKFDDSSFIFYFQKSWKLFNKTYAKHIKEKSIIEDMTKEKMITIPRKEYDTLKEKEKANDLLFKEMKESITDVLKGRIEEI